MSTAELNGTFPYQKSPFNSDIDIKPLKEDGKIHTFSNLKVQLQKLSEFETKRFANCQTFLNV